MTNPFIPGLDQFNQVGPSEQLPENNVTVLNLTDPLIVELMEKIRNEEKTKLYAKMNELETTNRNLSGSVRTLESNLQAVQQQMEQQRRADLPPDAQVQLQISDLTARLNQALQQLEASQTELGTQIQRYNADSLAYQCKVYLEQQLRALTEQGIGYLPQLVGGQDQASIDASIEFSVNEYARLREQFRTEFGQQAQPVPTTPTPSPVAAAFAPAHQAAPLQMISPTAPAPTPSYGATALDHTAIHNLTTPDALRSGDYARNRPAILARLQEARPDGTTLPTRPFPGQVPQQPVAQPSVPPSAMLQQQMPGGVTRPVASPMQPAVPFRHAHSQFVAGQPTAQPGMAPAPVPAQPATEPHQLAAEAAERALARPAQAHARANSWATTPSANVGEYALQAHNPTAPTAGQLMHGHPQMR